MDWPSHIETLTDFWAWQLLGERGYETNPLRAHEPVHARATEPIQPILVVGSGMQVAEIGRGVATSSLIRRVGAGTVGERTDRRGAQR